MVILKVFNFFTNSEENFSEILKSIKLAGIGSYNNWINNNNSKDKEICYENGNCTRNGDTSSSSSSSSSNDSKKSMEYEKSDGFLKVPQIIRKNGYPAEIHTIETADGYLLEMHRIPRPGAIPVYLQHGILDSSAAWILMGPKQSLAYILYDFGYDVWLGNNRGNTYSKKHVTLTSKHSKFWDFTIDEIATIDIPAMFDHIIKQTGYSKIHYVGHSQGTTAFFIMCQNKTEYCDKTLSVNLLSPIAFLKYIRSPLIRAFTLMLNTLNFLGKILGVNEVCPRTHILANIGHFFFHERAITQAIFTHILFLITGYNTEQLNKAMVPVIAGHVPAGASRKQLIHFGQLVNSGEFRMYDYGLVENLLIYGQSEPPSYDLTKVKVPVALYYALNDWLADLKDIQKLTDQLPNVIAKHEIKHPKFNHMDFLFAIDAKKFVYEHVIDVMKLNENQIINSNNDSSSDGCEDNQS